MEGETWRWFLEVTYWGGSSSTYYIAGQIFHSAAHSTSTSFWSFCWLCIFTTLAPSNPSTTATDDQASHPHSKGNKCLMSSHIWGRFISLLQATHISAAQYTIWNSRELFEVLAAFYESGATSPGIEICSLHKQQLGIYIPIRSLENPCKPASCHT